MTKIIFPPYGRMVAEYEAFIDDKPPKDWTGPADWPTWRAKAVKVVQQTLWPTFENGSWVGVSTAKMEDLTRVDFALMSALRPVLDTDMTLGGRAVKHRELFTHEDVPSERHANVVVVEHSPTKTVRLYLEGHCDAATTNALAGGYLAGVSGKAGSVDLDWKRFFQRPRPYQMSFIMGETWFSHAHAKSAVSPAMISGHCFEASMGGLASFYASRKYALSKTADEMLQRHTVDLGDRRVFAGVHYPSDNISSWITALLVTPNVSPSQAGHTWLWEAITTRSRVYAAIDAELSRDPASPYAPSMRVLKKLGVTPGMTVDEALAFATPGS